MYDTKPPRLVRLMNAEEQIEAAAEYLSASVFGGQPPPTGLARYFTRHGRTERRRIRRRLFAIRALAENIKAARLITGKVKNHPRDGALLDLLEEAVTELIEVRVPALKATTPPPRPVPAAEEADTNPEPADAADVTRPNPEGSPA